MYIYIDIYVQKNTVADPFICGSCDLVSDVVGSTQDPKAQPKKFQAEDSGWPAQPWQTVVGRVLFSLLFSVFV
jgi:hypothetical protein